LLNKINIITYPDVLHNEALTITLIYPDSNILQTIQDNFLKYCDDDVNLYLFDSAEYKKEEVDYILQIVKNAQFNIISLDNVLPFFTPMLSYIISKPNAYWFSKSEHSIYKHISQKQVYDLSFLPQYDKKVD